MSDIRQIRDIVRGVPVFPDEMPPFDPANAPDSPIELFVEWLERAVADGVMAPHAVNLATVDDAGVPDARVVIVKDVTAAGWQVASSSDSPGTTSKSGVEAIWSMATTSSPARAAAPAIASRSLAR